VTVSSAQPALTASHERHELLRWVAELYYYRQQSQAEIARLIGVSVSTVSRLLAEARQQGIVSIHIAESRAGASQLEETLTRRFGLRAVYVAPARVPDTSSATRVAALGAARLLPRLLPDVAGAVGFSGGYTIAQMVGAIPPLDRPDLLVVPLQGNWADGGPHLQNDQVCRDAAERLGARAMSLPAPMVVERASTRDALLDDRSIRLVTDRWSELRLAVVGVGGPPTTDHGYQSVMRDLPDTIRSDLCQEGVVGDLCAHMFNREGVFVEHEVSRRTLAIPVEELRRVPNVIGIAGGVSKAVSMLGALHTGVVDVLITDQLAAERLLELTDDCESPDAADAR
jgi:DNA-binding transcriptional regulator LsrR (DeoR family)